MLIQALLFLYSAKVTSDYILQLRSALFKAENHEYSTHLDTEIHASALQQQNWLPLFLELI